ncbi:MAG: histidinol dehydrogenase [Desulfobacterales bacterium]|nr:histidinol dehydrogenase [Desulfobacterales bacterium]MDD4392318.1 histidinol dehydrogenase [Desulfobacterales bacterium]
MKIYHYPSEAAQEKITAIVNRGMNFNEKDSEAVSRIIDDVKKRGDAAVVMYARRFDSLNITADTLKVTRDEFDHAIETVEPEFVRSLNRAVDQITSFHRLQRQKSWFSTQRQGTVLGQIVNPVDAVGVYVPGGKGGKTPLVSSVLMGAIPARIAGVKSVAMVTPPTEAGTVDPHLLVAAGKVGVDAVYKMGSAWAIAALAFGTATVPKVDVIVGPGNMYVTLAKKILAGSVGIDMIAGPSEILIIADETANAEFVAADLLSQAEHDPVASAILVTTSARLAEAVSVSVEKQLAFLSRKDIARASLSQYGVILVVPDLTVAFDLSNRIAPEHLELQIQDPFDYIGNVRNAGAVFLGKYTPEPVGDYIAGPNHVLPTAGTARFASALSVDHFIRKTSLIHYSYDAFRSEAEDIVRLAETEGLGAHANAINVRLKHAGG